MPDFQRLMMIVEEAMSLPLSERSGHLRKQCEGDESMFQAAKKILASEGRAAQFLDSPSLAPTLDAPALQTSGTGETRSGAHRFRILKPHAKGGLGEVYVAEDGELRREVALKEIQAQHADDPSARSRFMFEAEVTGGLEHPGIVPVYGLGTYQDGRPYYAMRFVKGDDLRAAIKRFHESAGGKPDFHSVAFRSLLRRFLDVCNAIGYAHSRGVLHRDIKPGNIMLGPFGETLVVDWGLAKVVGRQENSTEATLQPASGDSKGETLPGSAIGTPGYMSPEQADGRISELGPATDVYALGAVLHSLLTGKPPVSTEGGMLLILERVKRGELLAAPGAPKALAAVARKAMALLPSERYSTTAELAADVDRWLADEPVTAMREPLLTRLRRWARKHPGAVAGITATLIVGMVALAAGLYFVDAERARTKTQRDLAQTRLEQVEAGNEILTSVFKDLNPNDDENAGKPLRELLGQRLVSASARLTSEVVGDPLETAKMLYQLGRSLNALGLNKESVPIFTNARNAFRECLGEDDASTLFASLSLGYGLSESGKAREGVEILRDVVDRCRALSLDDKLPLVLALTNLGNALNLIGDVRGALRAYEEALTISEQAFGPEAPHTLVCLSGYASTLRNSQRVDLAIPMLKRLADAETKSVGAAHFRTLAAKSQLGSAYKLAGKTETAITTLEDCMRGYRALVSADHPRAILAMNRLAEAYRAAGRVKESLSLMMECLERSKRTLGIDADVTLVAMNDLAASRFSASEFEAAAKMWEELLSLQRAKLGAEHPHTTASVGNLGGVYLTMGQYDKAIPFLEECVKAEAKKTSPDNDRYLVTLNNLAAGYYRVGRHEDAVKIAEESLAVQRRVLSADHPTTINSLNNLAVMNLGVGRYDRSESLFREAHALSKPKQGADHPDTLQALAGHAAVLGVLGRFEEAEAIARDHLNLVEAKFGVRSKEAAESMRRMANALRGSRKFAEAHATSKRAIDILEKTTFDQPEASRVVVGFCECLEDLGRFDEAANWRQRAVELAAKKAGVGSADHADALSGQARNALLRKKFVEAEPLGRSALAAQEILVSKRRTLAWRAAEAKSMLGGALAGQNKLAEAETLLKSAYDALKKAESTIPAHYRAPRLFEAADRLRRLYEVKGDKRSADEWRAISDRYRQRTGR